MGNRLDIYQNETHLLRFYIKMTPVLVAYMINPLIFASSFFHSILDLRLTSLCKGGIVRLFR